MRYAHKSLKIPYSATMWEMVISHPKSVSGIGAPPKVNQFFFD